MKMLNELNKILDNERKMVAEGKLQDGIFGIKECKKSIQWKLENTNKNLEEIYGYLIIRGLTENGFNTLMIIACEQMIEESKNKH